MAFIHDDERRQLAQYLNQGGVGGIRQEQALILEIIRPSFEVAVLLIDLPGVRAFAVDAEGGVAENADGQLAHHGFGIEVLDV